MSVCVIGMITFISLFDGIKLQSIGLDGLASVDYFTFSPSIADYFKSASLVISHAGDGGSVRCANLDELLSLNVSIPMDDLYQFSPVQKNADLWSSTILSLASDDVRFCT
ncbi:hypothetical protein OROMI_011564 [Orobanche minor]